MTLTLPSIPDPATNLKLIIIASEPQSNDVTRAYEKAAEFMTPQDPTT